MVCDTFNVIQLTIIIHICFTPFQVMVEPMQVDAQPEENDNVEEEHYIVENMPQVCTEPYTECRLLSYTP